MFQQNAVFILFATKMTYFIFISSGMVLVHHKYKRNAPSTRDTDTGVYANCKPSPHFSQAPRALTHCGTVSRAPLAMQ